MEGSTIYNLIRALFGLETGRHCRRCNDAVDPADAFGMSESVCLPCRLDPARPAEARRVVRSII